MLAEEIEVAPVSTPRTVESVETAFNASEAGSRSAEDEEDDEAMVRRTLMGTVVPTSRVRKESLGVWSS